MIFHAIYYTYIVICSDGTYYTGSTWNVENRIKQHNGELSGGARYTKMRRPVTLRYIEQYPLRQQAAHRESQIKKLTHKAKEVLCTKVSLLDES